MEQPEHGYTLRCQVERPQSETRQKAAAPLAQFDGVGD
jgi:hypothetical protein